MSTALTVGYLYPYSNSFLRFRFQFHFPSVLFGLASLLASEVRFQLSGFFNLDDLHAVTHNFRRRNGTYSLRVALTRLCFLPWHRNGTYSLHVALTRLCFLPWRRNGTYSLRVALTRLSFLPWLRNGDLQFACCLNTTYIPFLCIYPLYVYILSGCPLVHSFLLLPVSWSRSALSSFRFPSYK